MARRRRPAPVRFAPPPQDLDLIRIVPEMALRFPEAYTAKENERRQDWCRRRGKHTYVRSVNDSLRQKVTEDGIRYFRVEESLIWCWDCGESIERRLPVEVEITEPEYMALRTPVEPGYQGVES